MQKPHDKHHDQAVIKRAGRKHAHDEHGGAWKVAFADFCLALLSLFLVLWLMAARKQEATEAILRDGMRGSKFDEGKGVLPETMGGPRGSLIERFPTPRDGGPARDAETRKEAGENNNPPAAEKKVSYETQEDLQSLSRALTKMSAEFGLSSNLETVVTPYGLRVMLHDTDKQGMFVRGSAIPTDRFKHLLRKMGPLFAQMTNQMLIVGHTDSSQYANTTDYNAFSNWTLSSLRAMAARAQLLIGSMNPESVLQVVGMADRAPLEAKDPAAAVNRRIELLVLTRGQAESISSMFGMQQNAQHLTGDVDTELPDAAELKKLRQKLVSPARNGASHAQE